MGPFEGSNQGVPHGAQVAQEYRDRMLEEIADIEERSARAGRLDDMKALSEQILNACTSKVIKELAERYGISTKEVGDMLTQNPLPEGAEDPFAEHRGPGHLLD